MAVSSGKVTIELIGAGGQKEAAAKTAKSYNALSQQVRSIYHPIDTFTSKISSSSPAAQAGVAIFKQTSSFVKSMALTEMNRFFSLKEDYIAKNSVNILTQEIGAVSNIVGTSASYAQMGTVFGPAGAVIGGIAGAIIGVGKQHIEKKEKLEQYQLQLNSTNMQVSFGERRASLVNGGRATEN